MCESNIYMMFHLILHMLGVRQSVYVSTRRPRFGQMDYAIAKVTTTFPYDSSRQQNHHLCSL